MCGQKPHNSHFKADKKQFILELNMFWGHRFRSLKILYFTWKHFHEVFITTEQNNNKKNYDLPDGGGA